MGCLSKLQIRSDINLFRRKHVYIIEIVIYSIINKATIISAKKIVLHFTLYDSIERFSQSYSKRMFTVLSLFIKRCFLLGFCQFSTLLFLYHLRKLTCKVINKGASFDSKSLSTGYQGKGSTGSFSVARVRSGALHTKQN